MLTKEQVVRSLFDRLATVYPKPAQAIGQAEVVAARCGEGVTEEHLETLAVRIIETRKQKTFPAVQELIAHVRGIKPMGHVSRSTYQPADKIERLREEDRREKDAISMLAGTELAREAVHARWAPALIDFTAKEGRAPNGFEQDRLLALSRRNDADVRDMEGGPGFMLRKFREAMHETAARRLMAFSPTPTRA